MCAWFLRSRPFCLLLLLTLCAAGCRIRTGYAAVTDVERLRQVRDGLAVTANDLEREVLSLQDRSRRLGQERREARRLVDQRSQELTALLERLRILEEDLAAARTRLAGDQAGQAALEKERAQVNEAAQSKKTELAGLRETQRRLLEELPGLAAEVAELEAKLEPEFRRLQERRAGLATPLSELTAAEAELTAQEERLRARTESLEARRALLAAGLKAHSEQAVRLQALFERTLAELQEALELSGPASAPAGSGD